MKRDMRLIHNIVAASRSAAEAAASGSSNDDEAPPEDCAFCCARYWPFDASWARQVAPQPPPPPTPTMRSRRGNKQEILDELIASVCRSHCSRSSCASLASDLFASLGDVSAVALISTQWGAFAGL